MDSVLGMAIEASVVAVYESLSSGISAVIDTLALKGFSVSVLLIGVGRIPASAAKLRRKLAFLRGSISPARLCSHFLTFVRLKSDSSPFGCRASYVPGGKAVLMIFAQVSG